MYLEVDQVVKMQLQAETKTRWFCTSGKAQRRFERYRVMYLEVDQGVKMPLQAALTKNKGF
jgi:hypothetical protein